MNIECITKKRKTNKNTTKYDKHSREKVVFLLFGKLVFYRLGKRKKVIIYMSFVWESDSEKQSEKRKEST